jgi:adenosylcobinamide kinase/adenosylcobinamide-phosphate guanylyltransferase
MTNAHLTLITGGSRSGKSAYALEQAEQRADAGGRAFFLATAQPIDDEMRTRIERHRSARPAIFKTIEEPVELCAAAAKLDGHCDVLLIDCLTIWISNLLAANRSHDSIMAEAGGLAALLTEASFCTFVVTDEVGSGIVPMEPLSRRFRDLLGWTNQEVGRAADSIVLMVAGHPLRVK